MTDTMTTETSQRWPDAPPWLEGLAIDRAKIRELIEEGQELTKVVEDYARRVVQARHPAKAPAGLDDHPTDVFEAAARLSGSY